MSNELNAIAEQSGLNLEMIQKGLGALLSFLKEKLGDDAIGSVLGAVPNADEALSAFQSAEGSSGGGLLGSLTEMAGKIMGGQTADASDLVQKFTGAGFSMDQLLAFLPAVLGMLKSKLPPEVLGRILEQLPSIPGLDLKGMLTDS